MNFKFKSDNVVITEAMQDYAQNKVSKLDKYFANDDIPAHVKFKVYKNGQTVEVTIPMNGIMLRAEETQKDLYTAIDLVVDKLERLIRKAKTKIIKKQREKGKHWFVDNSMSKEGKEKTKQEELYKVHRTKKFVLNVMSVEEAILQMNMIGHEFFVFRDEDTDLTSVVYRRRDDQYGLIVTE